MFWDQNPPNSITNPLKSINLSESPKRGGLQDPRCKPPLVVADILLPFYICITIPNKHNLI